MENMQKHTMILNKELIVKELQRYNFIIFAFLFGSYAEDKATDISDIDVGIYTGKVVTLKDVGLITAHLEKITRRKTDLLVLNGLYKTKPVLAFEVISRGDLIFCKDSRMLTGFKTNVFMYYFDTKPLRERIDKAFRKRLESGRFGERNYA
ncbi:MAG TPA: nucleotidyltransferase domain-containing protein [Nitrospirae bacterium]|nr:nucleotidyltransferase domain-containing protein [Nitrospirota bacterium]